MYGVDNTQYSGRKNISILKFIWQDYDWPKSLSKVFKLLVSILIKKYLLIVYVYEVIALELVKSKNDW